MPESKSGKAKKGASARQDKGSTANPETRLKELQEELFNLRFQFATRQLTNTARIRQVRRDVARVRTAQRQRELLAASAQPAQA